MDAHEVTHASRRMSRVQDPIIPIVGRMIADCPGTISLGQGVVHYPPPAGVRAALEAFWEDPTSHKYKLVEGTGSLLEAIERKLAAENGIERDEGYRVMVTAGANMAFMNAVTAITDPGDEIIIQKPYYFNHEMAITMLDCAAVAVETGEDYQLDLRAIEAAITERTRAIVTISPNNPTGAVYRRASLEAVNELCRRRGLYHICDEAYEYFTFDGAKHFSPGSMVGASGHTISIYSLSKAYGMASWRIGYMVYPARLEGAIKKIQDTNLICAPVICQAAAVGALEAGRAYCAPYLKGFDEVRALVREELVTIEGICSTPTAEGAFYYLLRIDTEMEALALVERLVKEYGVAAIPGTTFGISDGCSLRIAYGALLKETVAEGIGRLVRGLKGVVGG